MTAGHEKKSALGTLLLPASIVGRQETPHHSMERTPSVNNMVHPLAAGVSSSTHRLFTCASHVWNGPVGEGGWIRTSIKNDEQLGVERVDKLG